MEDKLLLVLGVLSLILGYTASGSFIVNRKKQGIVCFILFLIFFAAFLIVMIKGR